MQTLMAVSMLGLMGKTFLVAFQLYFAALEKQLVFPSDCPYQLQDYLNAANSFCPPPPSDHGAPNLPPYHAPQAICLLVQAAGLPAATLFHPYRKHQERALICDYP